MIEGSTVQPLLVELSQPTLSAEPVRAGGRAGGKNYEGWKETSADHADLQPAGGEGKEGKRAGENAATSRQRTSCLINHVKPHAHEGEGRHLERKRQRKVAFDENVSTSTFEVTGNLRPRRKQERRTKEAEKEQTMHTQEARGTTTHEWSG